MQLPRWSSRRIPPQNRSLLIQKPSDSRTPPSSRREPRLRDSHRRSFTPAKKVNPLPPNRDWLRAGARFVKGTNVLVQLQALRPPFPIVLLRLCEERKEERELWIFFQREKEILKKDRRKFQVF